jgi:hypothetical protein
LEHTSDPAKWILPTVSFIEQEGEAGDALLQPADHAVMGRQAEIAAQLL